eukprot:GHRR01008779.1.p1 GENE.GHRR01008779.1~~GHRR01008779.1.p1  ORF type:complete len:243 (+),score=75.13 GHRR01008779.1:451-1179(+)
MCSPSSNSSTRGSSSARHFSNAAVLTSLACRDGYLYVPPTYNKGLASPLLVMLHGAGGHGKNTLATFGELSVFDEERCLLLVPESRGRTWDMIRGGFGPDVDYINKSLAYVFDRYNVDPNRLGVAGFSDGASYALSLGLPNGNLFSHIIAFSPGFMRPPSVVGKPKIYISHGVYDDVLSIDYCSRSIVPRLRQMLPHAEMHYVEFNGAHVVRADISKAALDWFLGGAPVDESTYSQNEQGSS